MEPFLNRSARSDLLTAVERIRDLGLPLDDLGRSTQSGDRSGNLALSALSIVRISQATAEFAKAAQRIRAVAPNAIGEDGVLAEQFHDSDAGQSGVLAVCRPKCRHCRQHPTPRHSPPATKRTLPTTPTAINSASDNTCLRISSSAPLFPSASHIAAASAR